MQPPPSKLTADDLYPEVLTAFRSWNESTEEGVLTRLALVRACPLAPEDLTGSPEARLRTNRVLTGLLEKATAGNPEGAGIVRLHYEVQSRAHQIARQKHMSIDTVNRLQRETLLDVSRLLAEGENALRASQLQDLALRLPQPTTETLYGVEGIRQGMLEKLRAQAAPWVLALTGLGGIGKTVLARLLVDELVGDFGAEHILWVRASQSVATGPGGAGNSRDLLLYDLATQLVGPEANPLQRAELVRRKIKGGRYLLVVDNLETEAELGFALDTLQAAANPAKILLTSRVYPRPALGVYTQGLAELDRTSAAELIRQQSAQLNPAAMLVTEDEDIDAIYTVTGGNPLALKLVIGMLAVIPLGQVLADLGRGRAGQVEEMYKHIYWKVWHTLSPAGQALLQGMPLAADNGGPPEQLMRFSGLDQDALWAAIEELAARSLIEVRGSTREKRYGIHQLTRTFLHTEIIGMELD